MENFDRHLHWENIYRTRTLSEVSWFQPIPTTSLEFVHSFHIPRDAKIIDIGGGDSLFVDHLLRLGYTDITVLDISETAVQRARERLGSVGDSVNWIVSDVAGFIPVRKYDFWHDRATFHFLTHEEEIERYIDTIQKHIEPSGILVIGTFSENGPKKCSGIEIRQYSEISMNERFKKFFNKIRCIRIDHTTPFNTVQNFIFCSFKKLQPF